MLTQKLEGDYRDLTGKLTITCPLGGLAELEGLKDELKLRMNVQTEGSVYHGTPEEQGPPPSNG